MLVSYYLSLFVDRKRKAIKSRIDSVDTTQLTDEQEKLLQFDFIQYSNFEIMALFKVLFFKTNEDNIKSISGKKISYFEKNTIEKIEKGYEFISNFILDDLKKRKIRDSKIVNSVIFKSKEFYPLLKKTFEERLSNELVDLKEFKL